MTEESLSNDSLKFCEICKSTKTRYSGEDGKKYCQKCYRNFIFIHSKLKQNSIEFVYCACGCGNTRSKYNKEGRIRKYIWSHQNRGRDRSDVAGTNHWKWTGGRYKGNQGYWMLRRTKHPSASVRGYVPEHRIVWEDAHRCCLLPWIEMHHINEIRDDNRITNIHPITKPDHRRLHNNFHKEKN